MKLELMMKRRGGSTCAVIGLTFGTGSSAALGKSASAYCENIGGVAVSFSRPPVPEGPLIDGPSLSSAGVGRLSMAYRSSFRSYRPLWSLNIRMSLVATMGEHVEHPWDCGDKVWLTSYAQPSRSTNG